MNAVCDICGDPIRDNAYVCTRERDNLAALLATVIDIAGDMEVTVARQARYGDRGGHTIAPIAPDDAAKASGALRPTQMPFNDNAAERLDRAVNDLITWARHILTERGRSLPAKGEVVGPTCGVITRQARYRRVTEDGVTKGVFIPMRGRTSADCHHGSCAVIRARTPENGAALAARVVHDHLDWLRHRPEAAEAFDQLAAAASTIRRVVDAPPQMVVVGACDCGQPLYAVASASVVTCEACDQEWDVDRSRDILRDHLAAMLMTAAEAATFAVYFDPTRSRERIRKLITVWANRSLINPHGVDREGNPTYRFGDIISRIASSGTSQRGKRSGTVAAS